MSKKLLKMGDVIKADKSWCIKSFEQGTIQVNQNKRYDGESDRLKVDYKGAAVANVSFSGAPREINTLLKRVEKAGVSLTGKHFIVLETLSQGGSHYGSHGESIGYPDGHFVKAVECSAEGKPLKNGLKLEFYQTGSFNIMVEEPKVVGHRPVRFGKFEPIK